MKYLALEFLIKMLLIHNSKEKVLTSISTQSKTTLLSEKKCLQIFFKGRKFVWWLNQNSSAIIKFIFKIPNLIKMANIYR